jgi:predicted transcriptional regulator
VYGNIKQEFSGDSEEVLRSINDFIAKHIPTIDLALKISVNYSINELITMFGNFVKITPEGPRVWKNEQKLSDKDVVALQLIASKINYEMGKNPLASLSITEIKSRTGLNPKSISSRISEMVKWGYIERDTGEQGVKYKITTQGVHWLNQVLIKKSGKT